MPNKKITKHSKKQENTTHNEEKEQSIETDQAMTLKIKLVVKSFKTFIVTVFSYVQEGR